MSFSVDDPYELIGVANSLDQGAAEAALLTIAYISQHFGELGKTVNQFPSIPRDEFDSVLRDDFEPRLLEVGTDSTEAGTSLLGMAMALKQFHDQVPQVKSAAANLEQVLNQSSSPADWKSAAAALASALNNLYSVPVPSAPARAAAMKNVAEAKADKADDGHTPSSSDSEKTRSSAPSQPVGGSPSGTSAATQEPSSDDSDQAKPSSQDSAATPSGGGQNSGSGSPAGSGGAGVAATPVGGAPAGTGAESGKKPAMTAASLSDTALRPFTSTGLQSAADVLPGAGLGRGGAGGFDPRSLDVAPGGAASLSSAPGAGAAGIGRGMSSAMGAMMGPGMMGGRGGAGEKEHKAPDYLYSEDNGYELIEKLPLVSPDVIGALTEQEALEMELETAFAPSEQA